MLICSPDALWQMNYFRISYTSCSHPRANGAWDMWHVMYPVNLNRRLFDRNATIRRDCLVILRYRWRLLCADMSHHFGNF